MYAILFYSIVHGVVGDADLSVEFNGEEPPCDVRMPDDRLLLASSRSGDEFPWNELMVSTCRGSLQ